MGEWQPIQTCPKNKWILATLIPNDGGSPYVEHGWWNGDIFKVRGTENYTRKISHWMSLPKPASNEYELKPFSPVIQVCPNCYAIDASADDGHNCNIDRYINKLMD